MNLSPEEIQKIMGQWTIWLGQLTREGKVQAAQPLANEGKLVFWQNAQTVVDGPFAESKEAIGGYLLLKVDLDEAVEIAKQCPALKHGVIVEVRPIAQQCCSFSRVNELLAQVAA